MMNAKRQDDGKLTILYSRLSREDDTADESGSIQNQKDIMEKYAKNNGFTPFLHLSDDGFSGTNFDRPGWTELMDRVESGEVGAILFKHMDRIGRDYLRVGLYRETFRDKGVRVIGVTDGYDSSNSTFAVGNHEFLPQLGGKRA